MCVTAEPSPMNWASRPILSIATVRPWESTCNLHPVAMAMLSISFHCVQHVLVQQWIILHFACIKYSLHLALRLNKSLLLQYVVWNKYLTFRKYSFLRNHPTLNLSPLIDSRHPQINQLGFPTHSRTW